MLARVQLGARAAWFASAMVAFAASCRAPTAAAPPPAAPTARPESDALGLYIDDRALFLLMFARDEHADDWVFVTLDNAIYALRVSPRRSARGWDLIPTYPAQMPDEGAGARFSIEGGAAIVRFGDGLTLRLHAEGRAVLPSNTVRTRFVPLGRSAEGEHLELLGPFISGAIATGPEKEPRCFLGLVLPELSPDTHRLRTSKAGALTRVIAHVAGDHWGDANAPCSLDALAKDRPIRVGGAISDALVGSDARGVVGVSLVGYMEASPFIREGLAGDAAAAAEILEALEARPLAE